MKKKWLDEQYGVGDGSPQTSLQGLPGVVLALLLGAAIMVLRYLGWIQ